MADRPFRPRRSCLAVPGSNPKMMNKARVLEVDQVFLDLEDSVAAGAKEEARRNVVAALRSGEWGSKTRVVRINDCTTKWAYLDLITVVEQAGAYLDCIMVPKVENAGQVAFVDNLLTQVELTNGLEVGRIGLELQIESAAGLVNAEVILAEVTESRVIHIRTRRYGSIAWNAVSHCGRDSPWTTRETTGIGCFSLSSSTLGRLVCKPLMARMQKSAIWKDSRRLLTAPAHSDSTASGSYTPTRSARRTRSLVSLKPSMRGQSISPRQWCQPPKPNCVGR